MQGWKMPLGAWIVVGNRGMKGWGYRTALLILLTTATWGQAGPGAMTLEEAVRLTLDTNPRVGTARHERRAADEVLRRARATYLPTLDAAGGYGEEFIKDRQTTTVSNVGTASLPRRESSIRLTQRLFDGFETDSLVERSKAEAASAGKQVFATSEFIALDATNSFLEVIRQRKIVAFADELVRVHIRTLEAVSSRVRAGAANNADVFQTEVRLARSRSQSTRAKRDLRDAEANYRRIVGQHPESLVKPTIPTASLPANLDAAIAAGRAGNPVVKVRNSDIDAAAAEIKASRSPFYPTINFEALRAYNNNIGGINDIEQIGQLMVRLRWNLYQGGADAARQREALARLAAAKSERRDALLEADEQMRRAWHAYEAALEQVVRLKRAVEFSLRTRDAYRQQFLVAQRTLLDVLDSENELFTSNVQLISAEIAKLRAAFRLLAVSGALLSSLKVDLHKEADPRSRTFLEDAIR